MIPIYENEVMNDSGCSANLVLCAKSRASAIVFEIVMPQISYDVSMHPAKVILAEDCFYSSLFKEVLGAYM